MTREQFFDLAQRVQTFAQSHPRRYRLKVTLLAALGYGSLFGMMAGCAALLVLGGVMFGQPWFWHTLGRYVRFVILLAALWCSLAGVLFAMVRSLFVAMPVPSGRRVQREDAPELFAAIDEVIAASRAPRPHTVLLSWEFNASVCQRPRLGWLGWTRDFLVIGVPLMAALTPLQFKAVLAHEFGHLRGGHGRFGNWVYRLRGIWDQMFTRLARQGGVVVLFARFLGWYAPRFSAYTYALARAQEFEADRWAAEVAGLPAAGEALVHIWTRGRQLEEQFWRPLNARACREADVPKGVFAGMLTLLHRPMVPADAQKWLRSALGEVTRGTGTHPAPSERLASLGLPATLAELGAAEMWADDADAGAGDTPDAEPTAETSALVLLGTRRDEFLAELENSWRVVTGPTWRQRYERARMSRARLEALAVEETTSPEGELSETPAWERTCLEVELAATRDDARAALARFAARWPGHAPGRFELGQMLLAVDDAEGLGHVEEAMRLDARLAGDGEEAVAAYLRRAGQPEAAAERLRNAVRHGDVLDAGHAERAHVTARDRFLPHGLDEAALAAVRAQLARHPRVWKAWLARKEVSRFPEQPWYVMVCVFKWNRWEAGSRKRLHAILQEVRTGLTVAGREDFYFQLLDVRHRNGPLARKVRKTAANAQVYPLPLPTRRAWWRWWGKRSAAPARPAVPAARPVAAVGTGQALRLPPPLPVLPKSAFALSRAPVPRKVTALALCAAVVVVAVPVGYVIHVVLAPGGAWQHFQDGFATGFRSGRRPDAMAEASRPIPRDPQASTEEDDRRLALAWAQRTMLGGFDHAGRRNTRWNAAAHAFIEHSLPWWAGLHDCTTTAADLLPQERALLHTGCDDPLVLYLAGLVEVRFDRQSTTATPLFNRAVTGFQNTPYARGVAWVAAAEMVADCERRRDGTDQSKPVKQWWQYWFREMLRDGSFQPDEQPVLAGQLSHGEGDALWGEFRNDCCKEMEAAGENATAPWLRLWLNGRRHRYDAWDARGGGYANEVTTAGWRGFEEGLALARRDLVASYQLNPRRPEAAAQMISVSMGQNSRGDDSPRAWFDRAIRAQVDHASSYERMYHDLLPQWNGSHEAMLAFGMACAATNAYDTGVPMQLNEAAAEVGPTEGYGNPRIYAALERMYAGYEAAPSQAGKRVFFHGWHARAAELTGRYTQAYALLKEVDFALPPDLARELADSQQLSNYVERIAALGGAGGVDAAAGDRLVQRGQPETALERFRAALVVEGSEPRAVRYLQTRIGSLETAQRLAAGNWISFQPTAGPGGEPVGWTSKLGSWRVAADGALIGHCGASGLMLVNNTRVGPDFEVRGELDFLPGALSEVQSGVVFGHPDMDSDDWQSFRLKRNGPEGAIATVSCHWYDGPKQALAVPDRNTFTLQSWHGQITLIINGKTVFSGQHLDRGQVNDRSGLVGLGGYSHQGNTFAVSYRNLQIRRLGAGNGKDGDKVAAR